MRHGAGQINLFIIIIILLLAYKACGSHVQCVHSPGGMASYAQWVTSRGGVVSHAQCVNSRGGVASYAQWITCRGGVARHTQ